MVPREVMLQHHLWLRVKPAKGIFHHSDLGEKNISWPFCTSKHLLEVGEIPLNEILSFHKQSLNITEACKGNGPCRCSSQKHCRRVWLCLPHVVQQQQCGAPGALCTSSTWQQLLTGHMNLMVLEGWAARHRGGGQYPSALMECFSQWTHWSKPHTNRTV